jgi:hypothetical protein
VKGGLGNQLFMYSYAFSMAKQNKRKLYLVGNWYSKQQRPAFLSEFERNFEILKYPKIRDSNISHVKIINNLMYALYKIALKFPILFSYLGVINIDIHHPSRRFCFIIYGYGHNPEYFHHYKVELKNMLKIPSKIKNNRNVIKGELNAKKEVLVAIHIRRGDSVVAGNFSNVLPLDYFKNNMENFDKDTTKFLIFSDDIEWCKLKFVGKNLIFIEEQDPVVSLFIASKCNGYILSASSFSWWMAWLSDSICPIVYFPIEPNFKKSMLGIAFEKNQWYGIDTRFESQIS